MKKITIVFVLLVPFLSQAQVLRWQTFTQSISANDADTTFFSFRPSGSSNTVTPDSLPTNPPDVVEFDPDAAISIRQIAGTVSDSSISYAKPVDFEGRIMQGDSAFITGTTFAAPASPNAFGNGRLYAKTPVFSTKRYNGMVLIHMVFDRSGGVRRWRYGFGTR